VTRSELNSHWVFAGLTILAVAPCLGKGLMPYDLGELVYFSDAVREGLSPGRDYVVNAYGPGRYLLVAGLWEVFGRSFSVIWGLFLVLRLAITACSWELSRRLVKGRMAYVPVLLLILVPGPLHKGFYLLGTLILALAFILRAAKGNWREVRTWSGLGVVIACVALFRLDLGAFGFLTGVFVLYATRAPLRMLLPLGLPLALGLTAAGLLLSSMGGGLVPSVVAQLLDDILKNQTIQYPTMPGLSELAAFDGWAPYFLWLPLPVYLLILGLLSRRWTRDASGELSRPTLALACVAILGVLTCNQVRMKPEFGHLLQAGPMLWLCLAVLLRWLARRFGVSGRVLSGAALGLVLVGLLTTTLTVGRGDVYIGSFSIPWDRAARVETPLGPLVLNAGEHGELAPMLETLAEFPPGPIWVPTNQPLYFALTGRKDVTGHVGVVYYADNLTRQVEIIASLERTRPRLAIFVDDSIEGPERRLANAAPQVYSYLMRNYQPLVTYGRNQLMKRRGPVGAEPAE